MYPSHCTDHPGCVWVTFASLVVSGLREMERRRILDRFGV